MWQVLGKFGDVFKSGVRTRPGLISALLMEIFQQRLPMRVPIPVERSPMISTNIISFLGKIRGSGVGRKSSPALHRCGCSLGS
jgi:hypothetical protein